MAARGLAVEAAAAFPVGVHAVGDHASLVRALADLRPRVVLLETPPAGPAELVVVARERRRRPSMRAMLFNDPADVGGRLEALELGFDEAQPLTTPVGEIVGRLRLATTGPRRPGGSIPIADGLEIDTVAHELRRDGTVIHLRPKEYALLALLAGHPGRAYTRRQLLDRVWGPGSESDPRTVDVHVRWLRSKIEQTPDAPQRLVTVRGIGYRLEPPDR
jgi:DNA-binding response OmpR family regulator